MRVAEDTVAEELEVIAKLRLGVQACAGVVQVDVVLRVEPGIFRVAERIEQEGGLVGRIVADERLVGGSISHPTSVTGRFSVT